MNLEREDISKIILSTMEDKKISYRDLEKQTGISRSTIQRYLNNLDSKFPFDNLKKIAEALNISLAYLMGWQQLDKNLMNQTFANNLMELLVKRDVPQAKLAKDLNLSEITVSNWLNAKAYPEFDEMQMIADYFNVSKSYLQEDHNEMDLELSEIERLLNKMSKEEKKRLIKIMKATFDLED